MKTLMKCWIIVVCCFQIYEAILVEGEDENGSPSWIESSQYRSRSAVPTPSEEDKKQQISKLEEDRGSSEKTKKFNIGRIFFSMPIGAMFPIFHTSYNNKDTDFRKMTKKGKKSDILRVSNDNFQDEYNFQNYDDENLIPHEDNDGYQGD